MKRRSAAVVFTKVVAHLPNTVELTKLKSENSMTIEIRSGEALLGNSDHGSWQRAVVA